MLKCPAPESGMYRRDGDPVFHEDEEISTIYEEGAFYQESLDGSRVAIILNLLGTRPSSSVKSLPVSSQKRTST